MDLIAAGEMTKDDVLAESREMLHGTTKEMQDKSEDLAKVVWAGMDEDKFLGPCEVCIEAGRTVHEDGSPNRLRVIDMRGGKRFWGCEGYDRDEPGARRTHAATPGRCPAGATSSGASRRAARSARSARASPSRASAAAHGSSA